MQRLPPIEGWYEEKIYSKIIYIYIYIYICFLAIMIKLFDIYSTAVFLVILADIRNIQSSPE